MFIYGKTAANAIAVMSYLASLPEKQLADTREIAEARGISRALTSKMLTQLARAGLAEGRSGSRGGYRLGRAAESITIMDIVTLFEQTQTDSPCPFGGGWCGKNNPCPMHDDIDRLSKEHHKFMNTNRLSLFKMAKDSSDVSATRQTR